MPSIRITLNEEQQTTLKELLEDVLRGYYSESNIENMNVSFDERFDMRMTQIILDSILKKLP